jgi:hypothetical protein
MMMASLMRESYSETNDFSPLLSVDNASKSYFMSLSILVDMASCNESLV